MTPPTWKLPVYHQPPTKPPSSAFVHTWTSTYTDRITHRRRTTVTGLTWNDPSTPHTLMDITGYGPTFWHTTTITAIQHPGFCLDIRRHLLRLLHGRNRSYYRSFLSAKAAQIERSCLLGKIGPALRAVLQESPPMFTLETLRIPDQGTLTDHREIHNQTTARFHDWFDPHTSTFTD